LPTHEESEQFWRDWHRLTPAERQQFKEAVEKFLEDLATSPRGPFRQGLRVKPMRGAEGIFEMTWEIRDGRATFEYGEKLSEGEPHIIWRRIGSHSIFGNP
jgi:hypothetical protein